MSQVDKKIKKRRSDSVREIMSDLRDTELREAYELELTISGALKSLKMNEEG